MVQPLEGHARRHSAISYHADDFVFLIPLVAGLDHAEGRGDPRAGMSGIERVVNAFFAFAGRYP